MLEPKFVNNIGSMIRNCACFGVEYLIYTGDRVDIPTGGKGDRLPRQERMRQYQTVKVVNVDFPMSFFPPSTVPVGVELTPSAMPLPLLDHPTSAVYILGPEDGSVPAGWRELCHHIVQIPSEHCLNVAQAGGIVLYDRMVSRWRAGRGQLLTLQEDRGHG
jgi:tRNA G18 (ribose-2'-O)-methylase SpoU